MSTNDKEGTRINKYLSEIGFCSRREADRMIEQGRVTLNGKRPAIGDKVGRRDKVHVDGHLVSENSEEDIYLIFNKPTGIVTTTDTTGERDNIIDYINYPKRIFPIGRLDKASEGLIFMTNDGDIVNKILRAHNNHEKEYEVSVDKPVTADFIQKMANGVPIMGTMTRKCKVEQTSPYSFRIVLTQGLNRQIRRMCEHFGYEVQKLKRTRIMNIKLDVPPGQFRDFTAEELSELRALLTESSKTQKSSSKGSSAKPKPTSKPNPSRPKQPSNQKAKPRSSNRSKTKSGSKNQKPKSRNASGRKRR
jgi:23S rRNA pseudouridine2604 synthase